MTTPLLSTFARGAALLTGAVLIGASAGAADLARVDKSFFKDAAHAGHAEVKASEYALVKASDPGVKTFAQQMIDDHTKVAKELETLATSKGVKLPDGPSLAQNAKIKVLSGASGPSFDRKYADSIGVKAHEDAVELFRKASLEAQDADVKAFAAKTLPSLEHHLQMAKDLAAAQKAKK